MEVFSTLLGNYTQWPDREFYLGHRDRRNHCHIIGQTGTGKSTLLHAMAIQDIHQGKGLALIDPHRTLAHKVAASVPKERFDDVVYADFSDLERPFGINPLDDAEHLTANERSKRADDVVSGVKGAFPNSFGPELERVLKASLLALMDAPEVRPTLLTVLRVIQDEAFRDALAPRVQNNAAWMYFNQELANYRNKEFAAKATSTTNKLFQIASSPALQNIFGQYRPSINFAQAIAEKKILLFDIPITVIGDEFSNLLCSQISSQLIKASFEHAEKQPTRNLTDGTWEYDVDNFFFYIDEFQRTGSTVFEMGLSEARKRGLCLTLAHQFIDQIGERTLDAIIGNVGNSISFRVGGKDAALLARYDDQFRADIYSSLGSGQAVIRSLKEGKPHKTVEISTTPLPHYSNRRATVIRNRCRYRYGRTRRKVEEAITRELGITAARQKWAEHKANNKRKIMKKQRKRITQLVRNRINKNIAN